MTDREIDMTVCALQKSVIESGAPPGDEGQNWLKLTRMAVNNHLRLTRALSEKLVKENKE